MTLPVRPWAAAWARSRSSSPSACSGACCGEQHPGQHQVLALARVAGLVLGGEAACPDPAGGGVDVALGQGQPGPLRRHRVDQADDLRAQLDPFGLPEGVQRAGRVALGLPDPGQGDQAVGQRRGVGELPAQGDAVGGVLERRVELVSLVQHAGHAHVGDAGDLRGWPVRLGGHRQRLPVGRQGGPQAALVALDQAEAVVAQRGRGRGAVAGRPPPRRCRTPTAASASTSRPASHSATARYQRVSGLQHPLALAQLGQGPPGGRRRLLGVAAEMGQAGR